MLTFNHLNADAFENSKKPNGRKRPRIREPVACNHCRKLKVRCDRKSPCKQCRDRGMDTECAYSRSKSPVVSVSGSVRPLVSPPSTEIDVLTAPASDGEVPRNVSTASHGNGAFRGSDYKTRLIGGTHWLAACNDLPVVEAMLKKTVDFQPTWSNFAEVKSLLRVANSVPAGVAGAGNTKLWHLLPDRPTCEKWIRRFYETYGRIYHVIDQNFLIGQLQRVLISPVDANEVYILKILLVITIAKQTDKSERLRGRLIMQEAEWHIYTSPPFQKPCIGVMQVLLLLIILKTINASDTDSIHGLLGIMGLTTQMALSMGLQRDPALFPNVTPYYAEFRKRLWACFFRLNLDYCIRSGSQFSIRLEDVDCPLPSSIDIQTLDQGTAREPVLLLSQTQQASDQAFNIAAMKLAMMRAPLQQQLCSTTPQLSSEVRDQVRASCRKILRELPPNLQEGASSCSPIEKLQQAILTAHVHGSMIIITHNNVLGVLPHKSQRDDLYEAWDNSVPILNQLQEVLQGDSELSSVAYHFLWSDLARAALTACLVVFRLRSFTLGTIVSNCPPPTLVMFQQHLSKYLEYFSHILAGRYHLGPVVAKTRLILAVTTSITSNLFRDFGDIQHDSKFIKLGIAAAEETVTEMQRSLRREYQVSAPLLLEFSDTARIETALTAPQPLITNWMDPTQISDPLTRTLFASDCDFGLGSKSPDLDLESSLYAMAPFEPTLTNQSTTDSLWEDI
ncbi:uncharacterized protein BHQ10_002439 [Talaromyces amestolkiae]|uniref:Zn(2)-C6 fungal-type domain-containing protein n=1 Tax=Talaromyces amestolkiae TaxID=1196081 RepID=A0A364KSA3_TALAM|nr:uncharacterized protein BHQ10_002439 [Talaromyces amestolkiae]RAO66427.1 hypothetical protein BHQ10_002439 [Talaromyces amestolkiae]